jgi:hypothetical protein
LQLWDWSTHNTPKPPTSPSPAQLRIFFSYPTAVWYMQDTQVSRHLKTKNKKVKICWRHYFVPASSTAHCLQNVWFEMYLLHLAVSVSSFGSRQFSIKWRCHLQFYHR